MARLLHGAHILRLTGDTHRNPKAAQKQQIQQSGGNDMDNTKWTRDPLGRSTASFVRTVQAPALALASLEPLGRAVRDP